MLGTLTVAGVTGAVLLLVRWHDVVLLLFVAIVISTAIKPAVEYLQQWGIPRSAGIICVYVAGAALFVAIIVLSAPLVGEQTARIADAAPIAYQSFRDSLIQTPNLLVWRLGLALPSELPLAAAAAAAGEETTPTGQQSIGMLAPVISAIFAILITFVLAFYWTVEGERLKRAILLVVPIERREKVRELVSTLEAQLGRYIVGQGVLMLSIFSLSLVAYLVIGLPYALVLALIAGLMEAVPLIGPALGTIPAALVAYSVDPSLALWVILFALVLQQVENTILVPRIMKRSVGVHPLVTLMALTALSTLFGVVGALIAVPLAAITQLILFRYVLEPDARLSQELDGRDRLSVVRYETQELVRDVRRQAQARNDEDVAESSPLVDDLEAIAAELSDILANGNGQSPEESAS